MSAHMKEETILSAFNKLKLWIFQEGAENMGEM